MPLEKQVIDIPLTGGLAEGIDPRIVPPGSFLQLENVITDRTGAFVKRNGYAAMDNDLVGGGTLPSVLAKLITNDNVLSVVGKGSDGVPHIHDYSPSEEAWVEGGIVTPCSLSRESVIRQVIGTLTPHVVVLSNAELWVWVVPFFGVVARWVDPVNKVVLEHEFILVAGETVCNLLAFECGGRAIVLYRKVDTYGHLFGVALDGPGQSYTEVDLGMDIFGQAIPGTTSTYDAAPLSGLDRFVITWFSADRATIYVQFWNPSTMIAVALPTSIYNSGNYINSIAITGNATQVYVLWTDDPDLEADDDEEVWMYSVNVTAPATSAWSGPVLLDSGLTDPIAATVCIDAGNHAIAVWADSNDEGGSFCRWEARSTTGVEFGVMQETAWMYPASRAFKVGARVYMNAAARADISTNASGFVVCLDATIETVQNPTTYQGSPARLVAFTADRELSGFSFYLPLPGVNIDDSTGLVVSPMNVRATNEPLAYKPASMAFATVHQEGTTPFHLQGTGGRRAETTASEGTSYRERDDEKFRRAPRRGGAAGPPRRRSGVGFRSPRAQRTHRACLSALGDVQPASPMSRWPVAIRRSTASASADTTRPRSRSRTRRS
jgi:hypothetical protein